MAEVEVGGEPTFKFLRGGEAAGATLDWNSGTDQVRKAVSEALNARNVAVLLGAGCSSLSSDGIERGIPTMAPLAKEFCEHPKPAEYDDDLELVPPPVWSLDQDDVDFLKKLGAELESTEYERNLERLMELLFSLRFVFSRSTKTEHLASSKKVERIINKVQSFLWERCTNGLFAHGDSAVLALYESFYRKLMGWTPPGGIYVPKWRC